MLEVKNVAKSFNLKNLDKGKFSVIRDACFNVNSGECVALIGNSGCGKSTLMRMIYGNYVCAEGEIYIDKENILDLKAIEMSILRKQKMGYVSQFLRVLPRVSTIDLVMEPLLDQFESRARAKDIAETLLSRLNLSSKLWHLSPLTFSGGEQQRVNIAIGFSKDYKLLLLDEPTASPIVKTKELLWI